MSHSDFSFSPSSSEPSTATTLVRRAQHGDNEAFSDLYAMYCPKIYGYILKRVSNDTEVAQDLTADVFVKAMEHLGSYHFQDVPFSSWLFRIAHNRVVDHYRRQPKIQPVVLDEEPPQALKSISDASIILNRKVLQDALYLLTPEQRHVVALRLLYNHSVAETARALGRTEDAVKQLQRRALASLERILQTPTLAPMPA